MIAYGSVDIRELRFMNMRSTIDLRDEQWIDVEVRFDLPDRGELPEDISDLSALLICTYSGDIVQIVPQDEGRDCEYQFTEAEKNQLRDYYELQAKQKLLSAAGI
ncbi:hypothetical protein ACFQ88_01810 [Paenibacillus sp. NPDC056579]|uniref:hypothetical protein n=1 Tax=Paenibacillus sp. NPDC056579 TaxID=3345871 RepID=UPI0036D12652